MRQPRSSAPLCITPSLLALDSVHLVSAQAELMRRNLTHPHPSLFRGQRISRADQVGSEARTSNQVHWFVGVVLDYLG
jgi:hypothetical protein